MTYVGRRYTVNIFFQRTDKHFNIENSTKNLTSFYIMACAEDLRPTLYKISGYRPIFDGKMTNKTVYFRQFQNF